MKMKLIYLLSLSAMLSVACDNSSEAAGSLPDSPIISFEYVISAGESCTPVIDDEQRTISIYSVETSDEIVSVSYTLASGVSILPDPASRVGNWDPSELFVLSCGEDKALYTATLMDYIYDEVVTDSKLYPKQTYGREVEHHLFDLKYDINHMENTDNAATLLGDHDLNGIRFPIWGGEDSKTGYATGHPSAGVIQEEVYARFMTRAINARTARYAVGKTDFYVFLSLKSNEAGPIPGWCFENGVYDKTKIVPEYYARLVFDLIEYLNTYGFEVHVVGLDNESAFAKISDVSTVWMYTDTVTALRDMIEEDGRFIVPDFISNEAWEPKNFEGSWYQTLMTTQPETVDIYGVHYYPGKDHPKNFENLESEWDISNVDKERPFWASEPHWSATSEVNENYEGDILKNAELAMCTLWAQADLGMSAFCWWSYKADSDLRAQLMKVTSVPLKGSTPVRFNDHDDNGFDKSDSELNYDDVCRDYDIDNNNLKTRAFINGDLITLYFINMQWWSSRETSIIYDDYSVGLSDAKISGYEISYERWMGADDDVAGYEYESGTFVRASDSHFTIDIPARSITCVQFKVTLTEE